MTRSPLRCRTSIIQSSALVQASSSLSMGRTRAWLRGSLHHKLFRHFFARVSLKKVETLHVLLDYGGKLPGSLATWLCFGESWQAIAWVRVRKWSVGPFLCEHGLKSSKNPPCHGESWCSVKVSMLRRVLAGNCLVVQMVRGPLFCVSME